MKDYNRFIEIALGSSFEAETEFLLAEELKFGDQSEVQEIPSDIIEEQRMLTSFSKKL